MRTKNGLNSHGHAMPFMDVLLLPVSTPTIILIVAMFMVSCLMLFTLSGRVS